MEALPSDAALVEYLLGGADPADVERFDNLSVSDAAFAERLRALEHDLADAYARGELSAADRERWETRYLASQHGRDDLALAEALASRERMSNRGADATSAAGRADRRASRDATSRPRVGRWRPLAAAALIVLAVSGGYKLLRRGAATPVAQAPVASPGVAPAPTPTVAPPQAHSVALTLMPSVRSITQPPTLRIPAGTTEVRLTLRLDADDYRRYAVSVRDLVANTDVWHSDPISATGGDRDRSVVVSIPASTFQTRRYLINVMGETTRATEIAGSYPLVVVLQ